MQSTSIINNKVSVNTRPSFETRYKDKVGLVFISPWLIGLLLFNLAPILISLVLSFTDFHILAREQTQFIGVDNYATVLQDADAARTFWQTVKLGLMIVPLQIIGAVFFAGLLNDQRLLMKNLMRTLFFLPSIIPAFSAALMWEGYVNPSTGWLNRIFLNPVGLGWLNHFSSWGPSQALFIMSSLWTIGPSILIMLGAMQGISPEVYEAARIDGADTLTRFFKITIPLITSAIFFILILNLTAVLGGALLLDRGNIYSFTFSSYDGYVNAVLFRIFKLGYASSLAWVFFIFAMTVVITLFITSKRWVYYRTAKPSDPMKKLLPPHIQRFLNIIPFNLFVWVLLALYLSPVFFMMVTAMMPTSQLGDKNAPLYPAKIKQYEYEGKEYQIYNVTLDGETKPMVLITPGRTMSELLDPAHPENGLIEWHGSWRNLVGVYEFHFTWENFTVLFELLPFPRMLRNTLFLTLIGEFAVVISSILVAYGFSRFKFPGRDLLFYVLIATILIPDKVTFIPKFFLYVTVLDWRGTVYPVLLHLFFGNAVYIFLLRQNFKSIPVELEEAAMLDGAGPLRRLFMVVLPQSWPVVITVSLLHFFYTWNETRLSSLYLGTDPDLMPVSFGVQNYQSLIRIDNVIEASTIIVLIVPVIVLFLAQKYFMQGLVITGAEAMK